MGTLVASSYWLLASRVHVDAPPEKNSLHLGCKESFLQPLTYTSCWSIKIEEKQITKGLFCKF
jgi:hypothetical protein